MDNSPYSIQRLFGILPIHKPTWTLFTYSWHSHWDLPISSYWSQVSRWAFGLLIIWVGLLILAAVLAISWACVHFERLLAIHLLKVEIPLIETVSLPGETIFHRVRRYLVNPATWKGLAYLFLKFPLGVATFVISVTLISVSIVLLLTPFIYPFWHMDFFFVRIDSLPLALVAFVAGMFLTPVSLYCWTCWRRFGKIHHDDAAAWTEKPVGSRKCQSGITL